MRISRIIAKGLKSRPIDTKLGALNVIVGANWSGKTAHLTAIRLGLLGYDPKLGKRNADAFKNAAGIEMNVTLMLAAISDRIERTWKLERGSVKCNSATPKDWAVPSMLLDVRDYFALTAQQRRDHIFSMIAPETVSDSALTAEVKRIRIEGHTAAAEDEISSIIEELDFWAGDRDEHKASLADWMTGTVARLKERLSNNQKAAGQQTAVLQAIAQDRAAHPGGVPNDQTTEIAATRKEIDELNKRLGAAKQAAGATERLADALRRLAAMPDTAEWRELANEKVIAAQKAMEKHALIPQGELTAATELLKRRQAVLVGIEYCIEQKAELLKRYAESQKEKTCPTCGGPISKKQLTDDYRLTAGDLESKIETLKKEFEALGKKANAAQKLFARHEENFAAHSAAIKEHELAWKDMRSALSADSERLALAASIKEMETAPVAESPTVVVELLTAANRKLAEQAKLQALRDAALDREARAAAAEKARDALEQAVAVDKAVTKIFADFQQRAIDAAFGPFLSRVRQFTDAVLDFALEYRDGEIGYVRDGTWISHETFSGAEQALTYAGLGVALAQQSPVKIVMLDELILHRETKRKLVARMGRLIEDKVIDQFIAVDTTGDGWADGPDFAINFVEI